MDTIVIIDFGGQYAHLIATRIRRLGVYSEIVLPDRCAKDLADYKGIILSGSPHSVLEKNSPRIDPDIFELGKPILGLCYGHQLIAQHFGGSIRKGKTREYGKASLLIQGDSLLFAGMEKVQDVWMSHGDTVENIPSTFLTIAHTQDCAHAAMAHPEKNIYGLQFHPEVTDTTNGTKILSNFIDMCNCAKEWNTDTFLHELLGQIQNKCIDKKVFLLVSGGVDSTVCFALLNKALGPERVRGLHIDNGLMRMHESSDVLAYMKKNGFENLDVVDATDQFLDALLGVIEPEKKRKIIGRVFYDVQLEFQEQLGLNSKEWLLAQGTIYPDTIESAGTKHADTIKTHHNRVDILLELIEKGLVIEPLAQLYKDEVRSLAEKLGIPKSLIQRHPFPGPGLGVRLLCSDGMQHCGDDEVTKNLLSLGMGFGYQSTILPIRSVGVQGDCRTYAHAALVTGIRDWNVLERLSTTITNRIPQINRVLYGVKIQEDAFYAPIVCTVTKQRLHLLRLIDHEVTCLLQKMGEYDSLWQMPVVLLPLVNKKGDQCVVLRPVVSQEAMTAKFKALNDETISAIIDVASSIDGIGDIFYDITHKPPATIEWE